MVGFVTCRRRFVMKYHLDKELGTFRVVGFLIETMSIDKSHMEITGDEVQRVPVQCDVIQGWNYHL